VVDALWIVRGDAELASFASPESMPEVHVGRGANGVAVRFAGAPLEPSSVVASKSFTVQHLPSGTVLPGTMSAHPGNRMRFTADASFELGEHRVEVRGDDPAVTSMTGSPLDGEIRPSDPTWPTGDGQPGGNLVCRFTIGD